MIQVAEVIKDKLKDNYDVRIASLDESLAERASSANSWKANIYVSLHSNAGGGRGCEVYAYSRVAAGAKIARLIYDRLEKITPSADRGVKYNSSFYELRATEAPACLVEIAFHDNLDDANFIINNIELIGEEIAKGIKEYFGEENIIDKDGKIARIQRTLNERYGYSVGVDNIYGPETKTALVKGLQHELNVQFGADLIEDRNIWTKNKGCMCKCGNRS